MEDATLMSPSPSAHSARLESSGRIHFAPFVDQDIRRSLRSHRFLYQVHSVLPSQFRQWAVPTILKRSHTRVSNKPIRQYHRDSLPRCPTLFYDAA